MIDAVRSLVRQAQERVLGTADADTLEEVASRLDGPLRVAFAGRLKAGKSTLLNAVVGEQVAATDATECTRVVTWYEHGPARRVWGHPADGAPVQLRFSRDGDGTAVDLGGLRSSELRRLVVEAPNDRLERLTFIDTPGLGSSRAEVSARTESFLLGEDAGGADAVVYLLRHVHAGDVGFLTAFGDRTGSPGDPGGSGDPTSPVTTVGVLSRADELAGGRPDGLVIAEAIAARYRADPQVRALVQTVLPVSGLLAQAAVGLRESDHAALAVVAGARERALLSADRFLVDTHLDLSAERRGDLLARFGLFGVRLSAALIRAGAAPDAGSLARRLQSDSGLDRLRDVLLERFLGRAELLKARRAVREVERVLARHADEGDPLWQRLGGVVDGTHELTELRVLEDLRSGALLLADEGLLAEAESLLGGDGVDARARLRLAPQAPAAEVRAAAVAGVRRWQRLGEGALAGPDLRRVARVVRRSCEGLLTPV